MSLEDLPIPEAGRKQIERLFSNLVSELSAIVERGRRSPPELEVQEVTVAAPRVAAPAKEISPDLFLSHASEDAEAVRELAATLREAGLDVWLDLDELRPGDNWMEKLEEALQKSESFAVYVGRVGVERWINREVRVALDRNVEDPRFRVIPILAPGSDAESLPSFLAQHQWLDLRAGANDAAQIKELVGALLDRPAEAVSLLPPGEAPFRGLLAFEVGHAHLFFGRDRETEELLERLRRAPFLAVIGDSGSGKSSLVRAGLIPALNRGHFESPGSQTWKTVLMRPGKDPFRELSNALAELSDEADPAERLRARDVCARRLDRGADGLQSCIGGLAPVGVRTLLVVDQFEELFTLVSDAEERKRFIDTLLSASDTSGDRPLHTLITLRADFFSECFEHPRLPQVISKNQYPVRAIGKEQLIEVIEKPAAMAGLRLEPGLAGTILNDLGEGSANLALLEHTLLELWGRRRNETLTHESYEEIGRIQGALEHHAEKVFGELEADQQRQARRLFLQLVAPGNGPVALTRRRIARDELILVGETEGSTEELLQFLVKRRLVTIRPSTDQDDGGEEVEVAHETLLRAWTRLQDWLDQDREFLQWRQRTQTAFKAWEQGDRDPGSLLRGGPLAEARRWLEQRGEDLSEAGRTFIAASVARFKRNRRVARAIVAAITVLAAAASVAAWLASRESRRARTQALVEQTRGRQQDRLDLALLLSLEVDRRGAELDARRLLSEGLESSPGLEMFLHGHSGDVREVAWSPDGRTLASASGSEPSLLLWNLAVDPPVSKPLAGAESGLWSVSWSPDGGRLAGGGEGGEVFLWEMDAAADEPERLADSLNPPNAIYSVRFSPDGRTLAAIRSDRAVQLWDVESGGPVGPLLEGATDWLRSLAWSPGGEVLAAGGMDKQVHRWDVATGKSFGPPLRGHREGVMSVAWNPDGTLLAAGGLDERIVLWDSTTGEPRGKPWYSRIGPVASLSWGPEVGSFVVGGTDGRIQLWDAEDERPLAPAATGQFARLLSVAWSPDGRRLASGNGREVVLWSAAAGARLGRSISLEGEQLRGLASSRDATYLAAVGRDPISQRHGIRVWSRVNGALRNVIPFVGTRTPAFAWTADDSLVVATSDRAVRRWDALSGRQLDEWSAGEGGLAARLEWSGGGTGLAVVGRGGSVTFWDPESRRSVASGEVPEGTRITSLAWSPDGGTLAGATADGGLRLWSAATGASREVAAAGRLGRVRSLAWSPDGKTLASGSGGEEPAVQLWDAANGRQDGDPLIGHKSAVVRLAWSPDSKTLASAGDDRSILLWDVASRERWAGPLSGHEEAIAGLLFGPDGKTLTSVSLDGTLAHWDVDFASWRERACRIAGRNLTEREWEQYVPDSSYEETCPTH